MRPDRRTEIGENSAAIKKAGEDNKVGLETHEETVATASLHSDRRSVNSSNCYLASL